MESPDHKIRGVKMSSMAMGVALYRVDISGTMRNGFWRRLRRGTITSTCGDTGSTMRLRLRRLTGFTSGN